MPSDPVAVAYGILAGSAFALALISWRPIIILSAAIMLVSWWYSNLVVTGLGLAGYLKFIPELDAALALMLGCAVRISPNRGAAIVFGLFVLEAVIHVTFLVLGVWLTPVYIGAINAVFAAQCLTNGGASVAVLMARRASWGHGRAYPAHSLRRRSL